jgi:hypothetical protein
VMYRYALLCCPRSLAPLHVLAFCICGDALMADWFSSITFHLNHQYSELKRYRIERALVMAR